MPGIPPTEPELQRARDWVSRNPGKGRRQLAAAFRISPARAYTLLRNIANPVQDKSADVLAESHERTDNSWNITIPKTRICTLEELLEHCRVDTAIWEVERFVVNKWEVGAKDAASKLQIEPLFQVKAWLKKRIAMAAALSDIADLRKLASSYAPKYKPFKHKPSSGNMLELDIFDAHLGKLAWGLETGGADYDLKIAEERFTEAVETLIARTRHYGIDEIILPIGNDFQQADSKSGATTGGTKVDTDSRYQKTFAKAHQLLVKTADRLSAIAPVKMIVVPGNHDELSAWTLGFSLECWYRNSRDVVIDNSPPLKKFHEWGQCMLMLTHGDKGKKKDYGMVMATSNPPMFGRTRHWEAHVGHLHQDRVTSTYGVKVRILRALCPPDAWHAANFFVGNQEGAEAYVWNKLEGLIANATFTIPRVEAA